MFLHQFAHRRTRCRHCPLHLQDTDPCTAVASHVKREAVADGSYRRSSHDGLDNFIYPSRAIWGANTSLEQQHRHRPADRLRRHITGLYLVGNISKRTCNDRETAGKSNAGLQPSHDKADGEDAKSSRVATSG